MANSLIAVLVPEVEPYVAALRERFDPAAKRGLRAHITLRHAPMPPAGIDAAVLGDISSVAIATAPFAFAVTRVARFPATLYLAVEPVAPFAALSRRLVERLSGGVARTGPQMELVPHISVVRRGGSADLDGQEVLDVERGLAGQLARHGPIRCTCRELVLLEDSAGQWRPVRAFALSDCTGSPSPAPS